MVLHRLTMKSNYAQAMVTVVLREIRLTGGLFLLAYRQGQEEMITVRALGIDVIVGLGHTISNYTNKEEIGLVQIYASFRLICFEKRKRSVDRFIYIGRGCRSLPFFT